MLTFGEVFAGISGFGLGLTQAGMECRWQIEKDADCVKVLQRHYPNVARYGDVKSVDPEQLEPVDVIAFGWPCTDLSVAGLRAGLSAERSGLFFEATRLIQELRPKWFVAENVPGLFSSYTPVNAPPCDVEIGTEWEVEEDSDFENVLATLTELGYCVSWRVCDAQFWGVAQRRERVFLVGSLGALDSLKVFPFAESMPGDFETRSEAGAGVAATVTPRIDGNSRGWSPVNEADNLIAATLDQRGRGPTDAVMMNLQVAPTLESGANRTGGTRPPGSTVDTAETLVVTHALRSEGADASEDGTGRGTPIVVAEAVDVRNLRMQPEGISGTMQHKKSGGYSLNYQNPVLVSGNDSLEHHRFHCLTCGHWFGVNDYESNTVTCPKCGETHIDKITDVLDGPTVIAVDLQNTRCGGEVSGALDTTRPSRGGGQAVIAFSSKDHGADAGEIAPTPRAQNFDKSHINGGGQVAIAFAENQRGEIRTSDVSPQLSCSGGKPGSGYPAIAFTERTRSEGRTLEAQEELAYAVTNPGSGGRTHSRQIAGGFGVRRLTPRECERLQGFPDDFTRWDSDGKEISDSARYRMLGNAICVNVAEWLGKRIVRICST